MLQGKWRKSVFVLVLLGVLICFVSFITTELGIYVPFEKRIRSGSDVIWEFSKEAHVLDHNNNVVYRYGLFAPIACGEDRLVFGSATGQYLYVLNSRHKLLRINLLPLLPRKYKIGKAYLSASGVVINPYTDPYEEKAKSVYYIDFTSGKCSQIRNAIEARADNKSADIVVLTAKFEVERRSSSRVTKRIRVGHSLGYWDYDFVSDKVIFQKRARIIVQGETSTASWMISSSRPDDHGWFVGHDDGAKQIWIKFAKPFTSGTRVVAYDYEGHKLGLLYSGIDFPLHPTRPIPASGRSLLIEAQRLRLK